MNMDEQHMAYAVSFIGILVALATITSLLKEKAWWVRIFDFPRVQLAAAGSACLAVYPFAADFPLVVDAAFVILVAAAVVYQARMIFHYTRFTRYQVACAGAMNEGATLSLLIANVMMGNRRADRLWRLIHRYDPDVVLVVEVDDWWVRQLKELETTHPHCIVHPLDNTYGMALYSRLPLLNAKLRYLVEEGIPSIRAQLKLPAVDAPIVLYCLHPRPPAPQEADSSAPRDAELLQVARELEKRDRPAIVAGDLNDVAWSYTSKRFLRISGLLDPRIGRGMFNTFHARYPFLRFPLDHVFHSSDFTLISIERLGRFGSDHFPVFVSLSYEPDRGRHAERKAPEPPLE